MKDQHSNYKGSENSSENHHHKTSYNDDKLKLDLILRLNRIEGQVRGIKGMIEKDTYCDEVLIQIAAIQSAMKSVSKLLLQSHMRSCIVDRIQAGENEVAEELLKTIGKMMK